LTLRILLIALAAYLLLPQLAGLEASGRALARARRWWLAPLVLALEAASLLAYGELVRTILAAGGRRVGRGLLQRATMAGYALGRTLPGGSLAALAVVAARLGDLGVPPATTAAAMVVLAALALRPALRHPQALGRVAERATALIVRGRLRRRLDPATVGGQVAQAAEGLRELTREPGLLGQAAGWAAANWLLDLAVLATITSALGPGVPLWGVPMAYVVGQWAAAVPLTPGGVGLVESATIAALAAGGVPAAVATASVLGWRLVSHWLPIPAGLVLLMTLRPAGLRRPPLEVEQESRTQ
jgi:uncharacterized membrane protein YbhN (UPF0104 family)